MISGAPVWTMPRDMSGYSDGEAALLAALHADGLPEPVSEHVFMHWCCSHPESEHGPGGCGDCLRLSTHDVARGLTSAWQHAFTEKRMWRFDFAYPVQHLALEVEGGTWSGGRHVRGRGYENDCEKYNEAVLAGWRVLRFTTAMVSDGRALDVVKRALAPR